MKTGWIIGGLVGLAVLWFVFRRQQTGSATVISKTYPPTTGDQIQGLANWIGSVGGAGAAKVAGAPGSLQSTFAQQGRDIVGGTVSGFRQSGTGLQQIASGNVVQGAKNFGLGAAETAYSATGAKAVVNLGSNLLHRL